MKRIYNITYIMYEELNLKNLIQTLKFNNKNEIKSPIQDDIYFSCIEKKYNIKIQKDIRKLYSITSGGFIQNIHGDNWRILSPKDILDAPKDIGDLEIGDNMLILIDCGDNDFICYDFKNKQYVMYNIIDKMSFIKKKSLFDFFTSEFINLYRN